MFWGFLEPNIYDLNWKPPKTILFVLTKKTFNMQISHFVINYIHNDAIESVHRHPGICVHGKICLSDLALHIEYLIIMPFDCTEMYQRLKNILFQKGYMK